MTKYYSFQIAIVCTNWQFIYKNYCRETQNYFTSHKSLPQFLLLAATATETRREAYHNICTKEMAGGVVDTVMDLVTWSSPDMDPHNVINYHPRVQIMHFTACSRKYPQFCQMFGFVQLIKICIFL